MTILKSRQERQKIKKIEKGLNDYFELITAYSPAFKTYNGGIYEMELTRAAIHTFAQHCSKLKPEVKGTGNTLMNRRLQFKPNPMMDTKKYIYRLATMDMCNNNAFIAPLYDKYYQKIEGFYPLHPEKCQLKIVDGKLWLVFELEPGNKTAIEFEKCGRINQFQNRDELFGATNNALSSTLELMNAQNQAINEAVRNSSAIKFLAKLGMSLQDDDIQDEQKRFTKLNLSGNKSGVMVIDAKYADVKQLQSNQFTIDDKQMALIRENVFDYFGVSENIIQNKYSSEEWNAYYEGKIEPFALEMSLVHTDMLFTEREIAFGNEVVFTANRLQYLSPSEKLSTATQLMDRGVISLNDAREMFNMPPVDGGDTRYIRKEYVDVYETVNEESEETTNDSEQQDEE